MKTWAHDELAADLAGHLKSPDRMVWQDMQLGRQGSPRPDVYTIMKSYVGPCPTAFECKISLSDFRKDVTAGKWSSYLEYAHSVVFAVPAGLITKADVPDMCGLILRHETAWRYAKKATVNPRPIAQEALLKLLIDGVHREGPAARAQHWRQYADRREFDKRFGSEAARYIQDAATAHQKISHAEFQCERILETARKDAASMLKQAEQDAPPLWAELLEALDLKPGTNRWKVQAEVRRLRTERAGGEHAAALRGVLEGLNRIVRSNSHLATEGGRAGAGSEE